jgi:hypothetical protein
VAEGIAADQAHHEEDDRDHDPENGDRPEQAAQGEAGNASSLPDS